MNALFFDTADAEIALLKERLRSSLEANNLLVLKNAVFGGLMALSEQKDVQHIANWFYREDGRSSSVWNALEDLPVMTWCWLAEQNYSLDSVVEDKELMKKLTMQMRIARKDPGIKGPSVLKKASSPEPAHPRYEISDELADCG